MEEYLNRSVTKINNNLLINCNQLLIEAELVLMII